MADDFLSLYEEYLTDDAFEEYSKSDDDLDEDANLSKSIRLNFSDEYIISITRFLKEYLGFDVYQLQEIQKENEEQEENNKFEVREEVVEDLELPRQKKEYEEVLIDDAVDLYHMGLKKLSIPYVKGVSHEYANQHPEYVLQGYLVLVEDNKGKKATYLNPIMIKEYVNREATFEEYKKVCEKEYTTREEMDALHSKYLCIKAKVERINQMHMILYETHTLRYVNSIKEKSEKVGIKK